MIVADTCLVVHLFNETELTPIAQRVLQADSHWIAPPIWREEYANVLSKKARKEQTPSAAVLELLEFTISELKHSEQQIDLQEALILSIKSKISVYDAHFVALAQKLNVFLVTEDQEVLKKCPHLCKDMRSFLLHSNS